MRPRTLRPDSSAHPHRRQAQAALAFPNAFGLTVNYAMKSSPNAAILKARAMPPVCLRLLRSRLRLAYAAV